MIAEPRMETHTLTRRLIPCLLTFLTAACVPASAPPAAPAAVFDDSGLPAPPARSPRNASYTIDATLDPDTHAMTGRAQLTWRNVGDAPQGTFPFHLYWNAFEGPDSTSARGTGRRAARLEAGEKPGGITITALKASAGGEPTDLTKALRFVQPDDGNPYDHTLAEVTTPFTVAPGETVVFDIEWKAQVPPGSVGRSGHVHDFHFVAQWFPKIAGWRGARGFNAHQMHATTEFFADYGVYDVTLRLPPGHVVGATGTEVERRTEGALEVLRFRAEDVHDFAWVAGRRLQEQRARVATPPVELRVLFPPERAHLAARQLAAATAALEAYSRSISPYPYPHLTIVDPAWGSGAAGMEYPMLVTSGSGLVSPPATQDPERVVIHEVAHQWWYGLVGTNEFEESWMDEGFADYFEDKLARSLYGPLPWRRTALSMTSGGRQRGGFPVGAQGVFWARGEDSLESLRTQGTEDVLARPAWTYVSRGSYSVNSYRKPALVLLALERHLGAEAMRRVTATFARRSQYAHTTAADFVRTVEEVSGRSWQRFFAETWFSSELCDYGVTVTSKAARGRFPAEDEVLVRRLGGVRLPVEVMIGREDGTSTRETWDGEDRWKRWTLTGSPVAYVIVDPERKLAFDVDPSNNDWMTETGNANRAATRWSLHGMLWLQDLLDWQALLG